MKKKRNHNRKEFQMEKL